MGGLGNIGSLLTMVTSNPQLLQTVAGLLGNDGAHGGLAGLVQKFQQAGLGDAWWAHGLAMVKTSLFLATSSPAFWGWMRSPVWRKNWASVQMRPPRGCQPFCLG